MGGAGGDVEWAGFELSLNTTSTNKPALWRAP